MTKPLVVVMGVAGSGKTAVGSGLATQLRVPFIDADSLHPAKNIAKMAAGTPLTDDDRWPWLEVVGQTLASAPSGLVIACSALRVAYRDTIRRAAPCAFFVHLHGSEELHAQRLGDRAGHFMPASLLGSQLEALELLQGTERGVTVDISPALDLVVATTAQRVMAAFAS